MSITEIKDTKKLIEIINKDKEKLSKEEKKFLEEKFQLLLNDAKEKALKEKDYTLLTRLTCEEMRTKLKIEREDIELYTRLNRFYDPVQKEAWNKKINDYQINIRRDKELQKKTKERIEANDKYYKELNAYIAARKAGRDYVLREIEKAKLAGKPDKTIPTYCNLYVEIMLAEKYEIMIPPEGREGKTANQIYDYISNSDNWKQIDRVNGALDHATAQQLAADGYVVLAVYKNAHVERKVKFVLVNSSAGALNINATSAIGLTGDFIDKDNIANNVIYMSNNNNIMFMANQSKLSLSETWSTVRYENEGATATVYNSDIYAFTWKADTSNISNITTNGKGNTLMAFDENMSAGSGYNNIMFAANQSKLSLNWDWSTAIGATTTALGNSDRYAFASNVSTTYGEGNTLMMFWTYKNTSGSGHVVFVTDGDLIYNKSKKKYEVEINGLNTVKKREQKIETERFSKQFASPPVIEGTQFFYYKTKEN
jgi:hypothetical protein